MIAFWLPLWWVFIAELGDKTQLVALCFATRFNSRVVMAGVFAATLVVHIFSVALGGVADRLLSPAWISFLAGLAFISFGLWTVRGDEADEDNCQNRQGRSPFWIVASTFFLAELGDKTMLTTVTQAALYPKHAVLVWVGSTLGMVLSDGLAILVGRVLGKNLPERAVKIGASVIFFIFGVVSTVIGAKALSPIAWLAGAALLGVLAFLLFRGKREELTLSDAVTEPVEVEEVIR